MVFKSVKNACTSVVNKCGRVLHNNKNFIAGMLAGALALKVKNEGLGGAIESLIPI